MISIDSYLGEGAEFRSPNRILFLIELFRTVYPRQFHLYIIQISLYKRSRKQQQGEMYKEQKRKERDMLFPSI